MFTGIIEELGIVRRAGGRLEVAAPKASVDSEPGASVAVNGVCLTVASREGEVLGFDLSEETVARSSLGRLADGDRVNLERPLTLLARVGGHLVQGHVDGIGEVVSLDGDPPGSRMTVKVPEDLRQYVVEKGSIAVDGVSLTVTDVRDGCFGVALVPFTLRATTLGAARAGDVVNLEADIMAKYIEGFLRRDA